MGIRKDQSYWLQIKEGAQPLEDKCQGSLRSLERPGCFQGPRLEMDKGVGGTCQYLIGTNGK